VAPNRTRVTCSNSSISSVIERFDLAGAFPFLDPIQKVEILLPLTNSSPTVLNRMGHYMIGYIIKKSYRFQKRRRSSACVKHRAQNQRIRAEFQSISDDALRAKTRGMERRIFADRRVRRGEEALDEI